MIFRVRFRQIEPADIGHECHFLPEEGEYGRHFQHVGEDIEAITGVTSVEFSGNDQIIVNVDGMDLKELKAALKPILQNHFQAIRILMPIEVVG